MKSSIFILSMAMACIGPVACSHGQPLPSQDQRRAMVKPSYDRYLGKSRSQIEKLFGKPKASASLTRDQLKDELRQPLLKRLAPTTASVLELQFVQEGGVLYVWFIDDGNSAETMGDAFVPATVVY